MRENLITKIDDKFEIAIKELCAKYGAVVFPDGDIPGAYIVRFSFEGDTRVVVRMVLGNKIGSDLIITNMTTLPETTRGRGSGSKVMESILEWAKNNKFNEIRASQVVDESTEFWSRNGFYKADSVHSYNDFVHPL